MSWIEDSLRGRAISGVLGFGPGGIVIAFAGRPRPCLWIGLGTRGATIGLATRLPAEPDPRGNALHGLEVLVRGRAVTSVEIEEEALSPLGLSLARDADAPPDLILSLAAGRPRPGLVLRQIEPDRLLYPQEAGHTHGERSSKARSPSDRPLRSIRVSIVPDPGGIEALRTRIERGLSDDFARACERVLRLAERVLTRRIGACEGDLAKAEDHGLDRRRGEILLAHYGAIRRGASRVELPDPYADSPEARIVIPLDPSRSPQENAARLFKRAKKGERSVELIERRLDRTRKSLAGLASLRRVQSDRAPKEFARLLADFLRDAEIDLGSRGLAIRRERRIGEAPRSRPGHRPTGARESIRPRTFHTSDGWEVWVGRNNADNDRITHRQSRPHDYWFHVVGVPGSHVILRRPSRNAIPKPRTLEEAAGFAAYFSKARKLTRVPVIYTERKFVSKPRRAKPGQAVCTRERELHVRPLRPNVNAGSTDDREVSC